MAKHNLSDFMNEEPTVEATAEPEAQAEVEVETKTEEEGETLELTELAEGEEEAEPGENGTGGEEPKRKKPVQERFDKLVGRAKDAERAAEEKAREADYWRGVAEGRIKPQAETEEKQEGDGRPNPEDFDFGDADPAYTEALASWKAEQIVEKKLAEHGQQLEARQQAQQLESVYRQNVDKVKEELPDYDEVVTKAAARQEFACSQVITGLAKSSPLGPKILYDLAQNPDEAEQLASLPPIVQAAAFGAMAAQLAGQSKPEPKVTQAPTPANFRTRGSGGQYETSERSMYRKMLKEFR